MSIFEWRGCAGSTPLHVAVQTRSVDAVKLILASAAKAADSHTATALLAAKDSRGKTARSYADKETADIFDCALLRASALCSLPVLSVCFLLCSLGAAPCGIGPASC